MKPPPPARWRRPLAPAPRAVISPIGELKVDDEKIHINHGRIGAVAQRLYDTLTGIQNGRVPDPFGWVVPIA